VNGTLTEFDVPAQEFAPWRAKRHALRQSSGILAPSFVSPFAYSAYFAVIYALFCFFYFCFLLSHFTI
jgi:hypothetical protein